MLFDRQVRKLGRDFVEMKGPDISLVMDFSGRGLNLITDAAFLRDLLSDQAFPFRMTLEAKVAPNRWQRIDRVYPEIEKLQAFFQRLEDAHDAKAALKSLLNSTKGKTLHKRPIRIRLSVPVIDD